MAVDCSSHVLSCNRSFQWSRNATSWSWHLAGNPFLAFFRSLSFQSKDNDVKIATKEAIKAGYRLIDTAERYQNEHVIGEAIKECIKEGIIKREELFITTKVLILSNTFGWYVDPVKLPFIAFQRLKISYELSLWFLEGALEENQVTALKNSFQYFPSHENVLEDMEPALRESLRKLGTDYVDLYLIHNPCAVSVS